MALALVSSTQIFVVSIPAVAFFYTWRLYIFFSFSPFSISSLSSLGPSGKRAHVISRVNKDVAHLLQHGDELLSVNGRPTNGMAHENVIQQVRESEERSEKRKREKREENHDFTPPPLLALARSSIALYTCRRFLPLPFARILVLLWPSLQCA